MSFESFQLKCRALHAALLTPRGSGVSSFGPNTWLLGSGMRSRDLALDLETNYCHSLLHKGANEDPHILQPMREAATNSRRRPILAVAGLVSRESDTAVQSIDYETFTHISPTIAGSPSEVRDALSELHNLYQFDELMFLHASTSEAAVQESMRLLLTL